MQCTGTLQVRPPPQPPRRAGVGGDVVPVGGGDGALQLADGPARRLRVREQRLPRRVLLPPRRGHDRYLVRTITIISFYFFNLLTSLDHFSRISQLCATPHTPRAMLYVMPAVVGF